MRFKDRRAKQRRTLEEKETQREKIKEFREKKQRHRAAPVDLIVVENLNLTPPLQVAAFTPSRQDAIEQHEEIANMVATVDQSQPRRRRRKDIHPPPEKRKALKAEEDGEDEIIVIPNPDVRNPQKQLTPSKAERRRARVQKQLKRLQETPTGKRRQLLHHRGCEQKRVLNLTPKSAEDRRRQRARNERRRLNKRSPTSAKRERQHRTALQQEWLQQHTSNQRRLSANRKWFCNWKRKLTPKDRSACLRRRRLQYAEKQRARKSYGAEGSDHPRRSALRVHSNRCQTAVAKVDSSGRRTNTEYWRSKYRLLRKKRVFGLTENYLAQFNLKRRQKTRARKRMAERKMAKLYSTADEMRRVVQSDLHVMLQRFYKNNVLPASESVIDVENEVDRARKLAEMYGGRLQFHTRTHELFGIDFGQFIFRPIAEIVADIKAELKERDAVDEPDTQDGDTTDDILGSLIAKLGEGFFFDKVVDLIDDEQNGAAAADQEANEQQ
uniref:Uncharacterized protein n=1 Tax=Plectus sambesii TaxID=2011161 RepID=A0A914UH81_9BILA